jgi:hypothetical protein
MKSSLTLLLALCIFILASCSYRQRAKLSGDLTDTIRSSEQIFIYEGLPHQSYEEELLEVESKRPDITLIGEHLFYTPRIIADDKISDLLRSILTSENALYAHTGPKKCGGFHPDYAVTWYNEDEDFAALICFGCEEIKFITPSKVLHYDLNYSTCSELQKILREYKLKRPEIGSGEQDAAPNHSPRLSSTLLSGNSYLNQNHKAFWSSSWLVCFTLV